MGLMARGWGRWAWPPALPEGGDDAQQGLVQPYAVLGVVSQDPAVTGEGDDTAPRGAGSLQGKPDRWAPESWPRARTRVPPAPSPCCTNPIWGCAQWDLLAHQPAHPSSLRLMSGLRVASPLCSCLVPQTPTRKEPRLSPHSCSRWPGATTVLTSRTHCPHGGGRPPSPTSLPKPGPPPLQPAQAPGLCPTLALG